MTTHTILDEHRDLAADFSAKSYRKVTRARDAAIFTLFSNYGPAETQRLTGWTRPTISKCVARHVARSIARTSK
jgi:hypothetical protein